MKQLLLSLLTFFLYIGCTENRVASKLGNTYPDIFPDYKGISIPINMDRPEANNKRLIKCIELLINLIDLF